MLDVSVVCVGRLKERFFAQAAEEYIKRLGAYCRIGVTELPEAKRPADPSPAQVEAALLKEAQLIRAAVPKGAAAISLCVEGELLSSPELSQRLEALAASGVSKLCFIIGGSDGLHRDVKDMSRLRISMSPMTFPHHLARVMLLEQLYRAMSISAGSKYHK